MEKIKLITVRMTKKDHDEFKKVMIENDESMSVIVRSFIKEYIEKQKNKE